jgi:hypothetical protein
MPYAPGDQCHDEDCRDNAERLVQVEKEAAFRSVLRNPNHVPAGDYQGNDRQRHDPVQHHRGTLVAGTRTQND